jgi:hypothetical protein
MAVSDHDKRYMQKLAEFSADLEREELPPMSPEDETGRRAWVNERRAEIGLPPLEGSNEQWRFEHRRGPRVAVVPEGRDRS